MTTGKMQKIQNKIYKLYKIYKISIRTKSKKKIQMRQVSGSNYYNCDMTYIHVILVAPRYRTRMKLDRA